MRRFFIVVCGTDRSKKMRILGDERMLFVKTECAYECVCKFREKVKGTAEEGYMSADRFSACKPRDGLVDDGLEYRGREILFCGAVVYERLYIGFGKYTASGRDSVETVVILCILVKTGTVRHQECGHLVDERSRSASTYTVHTLFDVTVFKVDYLGIFTAKLYSYICIGVDP